MPADEFAEDVRLALRLRENRQTREMSLHISLELLDGRVALTGLLGHCLQRYGVEIARQSSREL
jgi:hypothetical protein